MFQPLTFQTTASATPGPTWTFPELPIQFNFSARPVLGCPAAMSSDGVPEGSVGHTSEATATDPPQLAATRRSVVAWLRANPSLAPVLQQLPSNWLQEEGYVRDTPVNSSRRLSGRKRRHAETSSEDDGGEVDLEEAVRRILVQPPVIHPKPTDCPFGPKLQRSADHQPLCILDCVCSLGWFCCCARIRSYVPHLRTRNAFGCANVSACRLVKPSHVQNTLVYFFAHSCVHLFLLLVALRVSPLRVPLLSATGTAPHWKVSAAGKNVPSTPKVGRPGRCVRNCRFFPFIPHLRIS